MKVLAISSLAALFAIASCLPAVGAKCFGGKYGKGDNFQGSIIELQAAACKMQNAGNIPPGGVVEHKVKIDNNKGGQECLNFVLRNKDKGDRTITFGEAIEGLAREHFGWCRNGGERDYKDEYLGGFYFKVSYEC